MLTDLENVLALGLQRAANSISLQCIPWPSCEWVACLTDFRFRGQMTPKVKIFENVFPDSATGHWTTFRDQILWKSAVAKLPKGPLDYPQKNSGSAWLVPAPTFPKNGPIAPKIPWTLSPLTCSRIPNMVRIGCTCRTYSGKIDFSAPKVITLLPVYVNKKTTRHHF